MRKYLQFHLAYFDVPTNSPGALLTKMSIDTMQLKDYPDVKIIFKSPLPYSLDEETYIMRYKGSDAEAMEIKGSIYGVNKKVQAVAFETENISAVQGVVYVENTERAQETEENE